MFSEWKVQCVCRVVILTCLIMAEELSKHLQKLVKPLLLHKLLSTCMICTVSPRQHCSINLSMLAVASRSSTVKPWPWTALSWLNSNSKKLHIYATNFCRQLRFVAKRENKLSNASTANVLQMRSLSATWQIYSLAMFPHYIDKTNAFWAAFLFFSKHLLLHICRIWR